MTVPSRIIKELQRTAAVSCLDAIYKLAVMSKTSCEAKLYQLFHGDPSNASSAATIQLLFEGRQQFSELFDREKVVVVSAVHTDAPTENLTLARRFTQTDTQNYSIGVSPQTHITINLLSRKAVNSLLKVTAATAAAAATATILVLDAASSSEDE